MVEKVFAVGGTVIQDNLERINDFAEAFPDEQIAVVTGAGKLNRYQSAVKGNNGEKDLIGIKATRLHAQTLLTAMDDTYPEVPERPEEVQKAASSGMNVVMGGLVPGYSTDAVAATVAELLDADLYIATTVDGVYTDDPEKVEDARKFDEITVEELLDITGGSNEPGIYSVVDEAAVRLIERSMIDTKIFEASLENLESPEEASGTRIIHR
ncbi:UMP kinase [Candidatus Nanosalina sp. VS9-1]|uniref:UMP kinase n=1 Tax=Candidatus Nanosalina sp. VS9-1 TaxID=3388566 RepID=UPI0039E1B561